MARSPQWHSPRPNGCERPAVPSASYTIKSCFVCHFMRHRSPLFSGGKNSLKPHRENLLHHSYGSQNLNHLIWIGMVSRSTGNGWRDEASFAITYKSPIQRHKLLPWTLRLRITHVYDENIPETEVLFHCLVFCFSLEGLVAQAGLELVTLLLQPPRGQGCGST